MHVITRKRLNEFAEKYPETKTALAHWYSLAKHHNFSNLVELKAIFFICRPSGQAHGIQYRRE
jgi:mRNA interferase HigB